MADTSSYVNLDISGEEAKRLLESLFNANGILKCDGQGNITVVSPYDTFNNISNIGLLNAINLAIADKGTITKTWSAANQAWTYVFNPKS